MIKLKDGKGVAQRHRWPDDDEEDSDVHSMALTSSGSTRSSESQRVSRLCRTRLGDPRYYGNERPERKYRDE